MRRTEPLDAYLARTADIHAKLARLQQLADEHFRHDPEAIHWRHVGDLGQVEAALADLLSIFDGAGPLMEAAMDTLLGRTPTLALLLRARARTDRPEEQRGALVVGRSGPFARALAQLNGVRLRPGGLG